tara:strand:+ start:559 stop:726 length:168 start_codon:yes stop_codon:yes gene_type:complete
MTQENKQEEKKFENKGPILETQISKSKDGKYVIHRTVITDIKPVAYFEKVFASTE